MHTFKFTDMFGNVRFIEAYIMNDALRKFTELGENINRVRLIERID